MGEGMAEEHKTHEQIAANNPLTKLWIPGSAISRRQALKLGGMLTAGSVLIACGGGDEEPTPTTSSSNGSSSDSGSSGGSGSAATPGATETPSQATGTPKRGGILRYGLSTDPSNFEPHVSTGAASGAVKLMVYSTLLTYDANGQLIGDLAEEFGWVEDTTFEVKLRKGVTFHNGDELTPEDVVFTFERIMHPDTAASIAGRLVALERVEAGDGNTVRFHLSIPLATLPYILAMNPSMIVSKKWIESGVDPKTTMMGTGPFKFVERKPGVSIELVRNENYFISDLPYLDGITFIPMPDDNARVTALRTGTVDFIDYVPYTQMDTLAQQAGIVLQTDKVLGFGWLGFVHDQAPGNDLRVRQAFAYALDREKMVQIAFNGHGAPITGGLIPEGWVGYSPDLEGTYDVDYEKAKSLLQEAGLSGLTVDMLTTSTYSVIQRPAIAAQAELKNAGIEANLIQEEWLTFRQSVQDAKYPVHVWGTAPDFNDPDFLTDYIGSSGSFAKQFHFSDERLDQLLTEGRQTTDESLRHEIYHEVEKRVLEILPWVYLIRREQGEAMAEYVKGYTHLAAGSWSQITLREAWLDK